MTDDLFDHFLKRHFGGMMRKRVQMAVVRNPTMNPIIDVDLVDIDVMEEELRKREIHDLELEEENKNAIRKK